MNANPILLQMKYARVVSLFAEQCDLSLETALDFFYHSQLYQCKRRYFGYALYERCLSGRRFAN